MLKMNSCFAPGTAKFPSEFISILLDQAVVTLIFMLFTLEIRLRYGSLDRPYTGNLSTEASSVGDDTSLKGPLIRLGYEQYESQ